MMFPLSYHFFFLFCTHIFSQEAFFGRDLLDTTKEKDKGSSSDSDEERASPLQVSEDKTIQLSQVGSVVTFFHSTSRVGSL